MALLRHHWASAACPLSESEADVPQTSAEVRVCLGAALHTIINLRDDQLRYFSPRTIVSVLPNFVAISEINI
jgi:hypothetical protein